MALIDDAKNIMVKSGKAPIYTDDQIELAIGWARGEVSTAQAEKALVAAGITPRGSASSFLLYGLKAAVKSGSLK